MAVPNWSEIATTAIESRTRRLSDNVSDNTAILFQLKKRGRIKPASGGETIAQELAFQEGGTYTRYSGYDNLNISPTDMFSAANFDWKQAAVAITISGLQQLQNSGPEKMIDLLEARIENAEREMANGIAADCYSDGTADAGKQIGGLQHLVADTPTSGTVGGIDRATWSFWRNVSYSAVTDGGGAATSSNIQSYMNATIVQVTRNMDRPDLILADNNYWTLYLESLQTIQRITNADMANAGFRNIEYMGIPVILDGGVGGNCPTNHMYMINSNYLHFRPHRDRNMVPLDPDRFATNQDAMVKLIGFAGNMTLSGGKFQAVLKA